MWFRRLNALVTVLFFAAAAIQFNDPDPLPWMGIYGAAGLLSLFHERLPWGRIVLPLSIAAVAAAWAALLLPGVLGSDFRASELFQAMDPERPQIEKAREMGGLTIVAVWMGILALRERRRRRSAPTGSAEER